MLYSLFQALQGTNIPGARLMEYITFRSGAAFVLALLFAIIIGRRIIDRLQLHQVGEIIRNLGLADQEQKKGTPTMGGIIIILAILIPCLLLGNLCNIYMILMLVATVWLGSIGFLDDYRKLKYRNKEGLKGKYKIVGQVGIALIVACTMYWSPDIVTVENTEIVNAETRQVERVEYADNAHKQPVTTIPFIKNNNLDYSWFTEWLKEDNAVTAGGWVVFFLITIFFVTATSNGANLNDGLDGMTSGLSAIIGVSLAVMAYLGSNIVYSEYLNIMYIPGSEELVVYMAAFVGALVGFLWYNANPAQVFMGDTGSLTVGGIIAVFAVLVHKELLLPLLCALFYIEDLSVIMQVAFYKFTGGNRIFKMTPIHHHFQKPGNAGIKALIQVPLAPMKEQKIVVRFWIVGIILAVATFVTLKIR